MTIRIKTKDPALSEPLHIKYRPSELDDVLGQNAITANLAALFSKGRVPHTFLFTGPSGCGKTTLARIVAGMLNAQVEELDAARFSGIDAMRDLLTNAQFSGLLGNGKRFFIIDESHALSKNAWDTLLLQTENPPNHLYFAFCTTVPEKVPQTIRTRAHAYDLKPVKYDDLIDYLRWVAEEEKIKIDDSFYSIAARQSKGSVRQALVYLSMLEGIVDKEQAIKLLDDFEFSEGGPVDLARLLVKGCDFFQAMDCLNKMDDVNPETIRLTVINYTANVLKNTKGEQKALPLLSIIQNFSVPFNASEKMAPVYLSLGNLLLGG